jgi:hypothetical protein
MLPTFVAAPTVRKCFGIMKIGLGNLFLILIRGVRLFNFFLFFPACCQNAAPRRVLWV